MRLYNTLSKSIEEVILFNQSENSIGLYACGLTVYDYTHLGHLRKYTMDDVLVRVLRHEGFKVSFVQNVTDVGHLSSDADTGEDKLEKGAAKYGKTVWDVARQFEEYFFYSMDLMGNLRPDVSCRATEHIQEQLEMVLDLEAKGFTYVIEDDGVYFDTSKLSDYGKLARLDIAGLQEGARLEPVAGKKNPTDFALWKFERAGENRAMVWESPWNKRSFPGWHIECSAMARKYLGDQFEIHTGGIDHIAVHHTNEIAQIESVTGKQPFVKYWVHHNHLTVDGVKMSKSLGNFFTIDDVLERGFSPKALRLLFFTSHYRSEMNFTWDTLAGMQSAYTKLVALIGKWQGLTEQVTNRKIEEGSGASEYVERFTSLLADDLKTAEAIAILWEATKDEKLSSAEKLAVIAFMDDFLQLGLLEAAEIALSEQKVEKPMPEAVRDLFTQREAAREARDWELADRLRDTIIEQGFSVSDDKA